MDSNLKALALKRISKSRKDRIQDALNNNTSDKIEKELMDLDRRVFDITEEGREDDYDSVDRRLMNNLKRLRQR